MIALFLPGVHYRQKELVADHEPPRVREDWWVVLFYLYRTLEIFGDSSDMTEHSTSTFQYRTSFTCLLNWRFHVPSPADETYSTNDPSPTSAYMKKFLRVCTAQWTRNNEDKEVQIIIPLQQLSPFCAECYLPPPLVKLSPLTKSNAMYKVFLLKMD